MSGFEWLSRLMDRIIDLIPWYVIVRADQQAVFFIFGAYTIEAGPGWYPVWDLIMDYYLFDVKQDTVVTSAVVTTKEGKKLAIKAVIQHEIASAKTLALATNDYAQVISDVAKMSLRRAVSQLTEDDINDDEKTTKALKHEARRKLHRFGVKVLDFGITDVAPEPMVHSLWGLDELQIGQ